MKLFLSSYRTGNYGNRLIELFGKSARVAVVTNAKDYKPVERTESVRDSLAALARLGFSATELDLRNYFGKQTDWRTYFNDYDAVWLGGGNTFVLRRALAKTGLDAFLGRQVRAGTLAYGGESAGAIMATPDFTGVQFGDDPDILPDGYSESTPWEGLGFVNYNIVPHYQSEWAGADAMVKALLEAHKEFKTLTNEQVIIIDGAHEELLG